MTCGHRTALLPVSVLSCLILQSVAAAQQPPPASAQQAPQGQRTPTPAPAPRGFESRAIAQGFSVVLVLADLQASSAPDDVPPAARRALADMKDFLPYKSYKLLDAAWILGSGGSGTATRLRGPEEQEYELRMSTTSASGGRGGTTPEPGQAGRASSGTVFVRFTLIETGSSEREHFEAAVAVEERRSVEERVREERAVEIVKLEAELKAAEQQKNEAKVRELRSALARARTRAERPSTSQASTRPPRRSGGPVIDTSFNMDIGETVVVGTSRLKGNSRALIALLTAVPVKGSRIPTTDAR